MLRIIIGNKAYSSWSLRGWLAVKQSGLPFEEQVMNMDGPGWEARHDSAEIAVANGKVPVIWHDGTPVWDSLAILDYLDDITGGKRFWPQDTAARALARSIAAEMHSSYVPLRSACPMNVRRIFPAETPSDAVMDNLQRIISLWDQARTKFGKGGPYLFGEFGAADIMFAPVIFRVWGYSLPVPSTIAHDYVEAMLAHSWMKDWAEAAKAEPWVLDKYEQGPAYS